ncbi:MAG: dihydrofolate reductase [Xanthomarina sp.]|uniref:dihydrofolate reductase n=1 Tax=Xanthomarina TaxID=1868329 RepID=UPI000C5CC799|nr:dihydrofolate reductase [Xanthomarina sp.]MDX1316503.1 dihydrofolate reductase [Xanthomarina gelatinilytica]MAL24027.1 dihydrofolate reductase [Xanthomarina sp.]MBF62430.1 dihydrofolate reductase [Xanthomarina sp.]HAB28261.1 dihydrofolate reductase [Xanthomarina gelatinilytica]HAI17435.1 dihydrofolate reductase [Xanthomarina gelatinilytica]
MFGKKKETPQIDKEQLELIETAQKRIKQKKRLYAHFVVFLIGAVFLIVANLVLNIGKDVTFLGIDWFVFAILAWLFLFVYHLFNVFVTSKMLSKKWEEKQLNKLVEKQKERIAQLQQQVEKDYPLSTEKKKTITSSKNSEITLIVAAGENDAIGKDNQLIWHLSDDLKRFKELTNGHHIIMGRKTFESFPRPLPNRTHIVISRQDNYQVPSGVILVNNLEDAFDAAKADKQPFVIGGGEIYKQAMPYADKIELTRVHEDFEADTFFPKIDTTIWKESQNRYHAKDEKHQHAFSFITYIRQ